MIITLVNANFSQNNIGTLDSYSVRTSGSHFTFSGASSIKKNELPDTYTGTITTTNNYVLTSVVVKIGNTQFSSDTYTTESATTTHTISIPKANLTGNILITVGTYGEGSGSGGEGGSTYTFTISPTPSTATVTLTASGYTQSGNSITVPNGTTVSWSVSASGYTTKSGTWTANGSNKTENVVLVASGGDATLLMKNGSGINTFNRLARNAYVANMKQMFSAGSTIEYIEIPLVTSKALTTTETTIPEFNLWVFNADTNTPIEKVISAQSYTSQSSDTFGCQAIKVDVNRSFDYPFYFGYSNTTGANDTAVAYYNESHNYLSGTEFTIGTAIAATFDSVAIYCAIYGEGSTYTPIIPDDVNSLTQIAYYNEDASSIMAGDCYIAVSDNTVPANTKITTLDIKAGAGQVEGLNVYVVNADTDTIIEMLQDEATVNTVYSSRIVSDVVRLNVDKTYTHPVYFMFNSERTGSNKIGLKIKSGASSNSLLLTDDETKPAVGDVLSGFKAGYGIGHAIYS